MGTVRVVGGGDCTARDILVSQGMGPLVIEDRASTLIGGGEGSKTSTDVDVDMIGRFNGRGLRCCALLLVLALVVWQ